MSDHEDHFPLGSMLVQKHLEEFVILREITYGLLTYITALTLSNPFNSAPKEENNS